LERVSRVLTETATTLVSTREDAEGFARKIALLEDELVVERRAREVPERDYREQFEELTLLQTRGSELCHIIVSLTRARHHLSKGMRLVALHHTEMAGELASLLAIVPSVAESVLGCSPTDAFHEEVVGELAEKF
jgi:hypothetical protein